MKAEEATREELALRSLHDLLMAVSAGHDLRTVLQQTAEGVVEALGFDLTVVNYLHDDGYLEILAVAGDPEARAAMQGRRIRVEDYLEEFELADRWGNLRFVPYDRLPADAVSTWVPSVLPLDLPDAWHPMDALHAPLHGPDGEMVGVLGVDLPRDGRRPGELKRQVLEMYAAQAGLAIHLARAREREQAIVEELRALGRYRDEVNLALTHRAEEPAHRDPGPRPAPGGGRRGLPLAAVDRAGGRADERPGRQPPAPRAGPGPHPGAAPADGRPRRRGEGGRRAPGGPGRPGLGSTYRWRCRGLRRPPATPTSC